jgi:hypothetical protein
MNERRLAHRLEVHLPARYSSQSASMSGVVSSLSRSGLFLCSDFLEGPGEQASLRLELPGEAEPLLLSGVVVRATEDPRRAGMGLRFDSLPSATRRRLGQFLIERGYRAAFAPGGGV